MQLYIQMLFTRIQFQNLKTSFQFRVLVAVLEMLALVMPFLLNPTTLYVLE